MPDELMRHGMPVHGLASHSVWVMHSPHWGRANSGTETSSNSVQARTTRMSFIDFSLRRERSPRGSMHVRQQNGNDFRRAIESIAVNQPSNPQFEVVVRARTCVVTTEAQRG